MSEPQFDPSSIRYVEAMDTVRDAHPKPMSRATGKVLRRLDKHCKTILQHATFCVIGTHGPDGADVSPRGDPAGFVRVWMTATSCCPTGSATTGSTATPTYSRIRRIGMLFLVPGMSEVLRINGLARVTDDAGVLAASAVQGRAPKFGLLIEVREAYLHCAKAVNRAALWDPSKHINRSTLPSYGTMLATRSRGCRRKKASGRAPRWRAAACIDRLVRDTQGAPLLDVPFRRAQRPALLKGSLNRPRSASSMKPANTAAKGSPNMKISAECLRWPNCVRCGARSEMKYRL